MGIDIFIPDCLLGLGYFYIKRRRMTKQEIICMAQEAQMPFYWRTGEITYLDKLERFAALVASAERERIKQANAPEIERINAHIKELEDDVKAEREACAKVCEEQMQGKSIWIEGARACSLAIRARGQA